MIRFQKFKEGGETVKNKILFISLAVVLALSVGLVGCGGTTTPPWPTNAPQGTLTIERASLGTTETFLPWTCAAIEKNYMSGTIYESLTMRGVNADVTWCLATNAVMSADGKNWTVTIRQGVPFHDSAGNLYGNVTAEDVKYTFERLASNGTNVNFYSTSTQYPAKVYPTSISNIAGGLRGDLGSNVSAAIEVVGTDTVIFHLVVPDIRFMQTYTGPDMCGVVKKSYVDAWGDLVASQNPVGTGPYVVDSHLPGNYIQLEVVHFDSLNWTNHWRYGPLTASDPTKYFRYIKFKKQATLSTRVNDLLSGAADYVEIDYTVTLTGNNTVQDTITFTKSTDVIRLGGLDQLDTSASPARYDPTNPWANSTVIRPSDISINGITYNYTAGTLVRKALNYAINKTALIEAVYSHGAGGAAVATASMSLTEWAGLPAYTFNATLAESLLDEAGYPRSAPNATDRFTITLLDDGRYSHYLNAELIKDMWKAVGINVIRESTTWQVLRPRWALGYGKPNNIVTGYGWMHRTPPASGDPAMAVNMAFDPSAVIGDYSESNEDALRVALLTDTSEAQRANDILYFGQYVNDQAAQVFLVSTYTLVGVSNALNVAGTRSTINVFDLDENPELIHRV
jgi:ABC-type transport system substrate-binding protein